MIAEEQPGHHLGDAAGRRPVEVRPGPGDPEAGDNAQVAGPVHRELRELVRQQPGRDAGRPVGEKAYAAIWTMADAPGSAVPFLRGRLRPATGPSDKQAAELIAKLDAPAFATREAAEKELTAFGDAAVLSLHAALQAKPSSEQTARLERLLTAATHPIPTRDVLQQLRAVAVLEQAGTPEAKATLKDLAGGAAGARLTTEAVAALGRLSR